MKGSPEISSLRVPSGKGMYKTRLYKAVKRHGLSSDYEDTIVLAPGWLGSGTLHFAASSLARRGHNVAVVNHNHSSLFSPNAARSRHVHLTAKAAAAETGNRGIILIGHSNGNQDIHHAATEAIRRQSENPDDRSLYLIRAVGSIAGTGLSGRVIDGQGFYKEIAGLAKELVNHPVAELDIVARSLVNFMQHPLRSAAEGLSAAYCDVRLNASHLINTDIMSEPIRAYSEVYMEYDGVIPLPDDRDDFTVMPGSHTTPIVDSDMLECIATGLYEDNAPRRLQIAGFRSAA